MDKTFQGIYAALITPYQADGSINFDELQKLVEYLISQNIDGFYVCGSTAEAFLLSAEERKSILEAVIEANQHRKKVICHIGSISTDEAISFAEHAQRAGANAISAISPFYYSFTNQEIISYYHDIMQSSSLPMFLYHFPNNSHFSLTEEILDELKKSPTLKGIKFTSSDMFLMERIKTNYPELTVWNGFDEMLLAGLSMGADGGIGSTYNCMPGLIRKIYDCYLVGDMVNAHRYQQQANHVIKTICKYGVFASVKTLLSFMGFENHGCRRPFAPITDEGRNELEEIYRKYIAN